MRQLALITGASRGIGKAIHKKLFLDGFDVIGTASSQKNIALIKENTNDPERTLALSGNLAEPKACIAQWSDAIQEHFGRQPDVIVANAGLTKDNLLLRMTDDQWYDVMQVNLNANYYLAKQFVKPMMKNRFGRFVFLGSVSGMGNPGQINYASAKSGLCGLSRSLSLEYGARNITSNVVAPGFIETDMTNSLTEDQQKAIIDKIPVRRYGQVTDVANLVAFLVSEAGNYITGQTINVNGGLLVT
jgi:3-oxoacyl-[acyl-carrier protein] reductase